MKKVYKTFFRTILTHFALHAHGKNSQNSQTAQSDRGYTEKNALSAKQAGKTATVWRPRRNHFHNFFEPSEKLKIVKLIVKKTNF